MNIRHVAIELFKESLELPRDYRAEWSVLSVLIRGPSEAIDYLEGFRSGYDQVTAVHFDDDRAHLYIYEEYEQILAVGDAIYLEYGDPRYPQLLISTMERLIEHHGVLLESSRDEYVSFVLEQKRQGKILPEIDDLPGEHQDSWDFTHRRVRA